MTSSASPFELFVVLQLPLNITISLSSRIVEIARVRLGRGAWEGEVGSAVVGVRRVGLEVTPTVGATMEIGHGQPRESIDGTFSDANLLLGAVCVIASSSIPHQYTCAGFTSA